MKKFLKSLMAAAVALVVVTNVGGAVVTAEAAICPPHREYKEIVLWKRDVGYQHNAIIKVYGTDEFGNKIDITDSLPNPPRETCIVRLQEVCVIVRCKYCNKQVYSYIYTTPENHSSLYCGEG